MFRWSMAQSWSPMFTNVGHYHMYNQCNSGQLACQLAAIYVSRASNVYLCGLVTWNLAVAYICLLSMSLRVQHCVVWTTSYNIGAVKLSDLLHNALGMYSNAQSMQTWLWKSKTKCQSAYIHSTTLPESLDYGHCIEFELTLSRTHLHTHGKAHALPYKTRPRIRENASKSQKTT